MGAKTSFASSWQMFHWCFSLFHSYGWFQIRESKESNARVCSCIDYIFVDCCDTYCKYLLTMLMVFVVLRLLALSCLRKAESPTRVSALALTTFLLIVVILLANVY